MYLSSRSISQANITRDFINTLVQGEHRMPLGPVIISPHGLLPSLYRWGGGAGEGPWKPMEWGRRGEG